MSTTTLPSALDAELATVIRTYTEVTERLKRSHEVLHAEVRRLRDEVHEKNRELARRERLAALGEMAAGVAHEIRNPLGGIDLYASLLEKDLEPLPAQRDLVKRIRSGVRNLESVVGGVLAFAGDREPVVREVTLSAIIDDVLPQVTPSLEAAEASIETGVASTDVLLRCDPRQVERALLNLILNAIDAAGRGGWVGVRVEERSRAGELIGIVVEDNGPGIPPELLHRVFNPFFTTKENGTGLGLAIVHRIADAHGGYVEAGNRPEGGARFTLALPLAPQHRAE